MKKLISLILSGPVIFLPIKSFAECIRSEKIFPIGKSWLRVDRNEELTFWWKFKPPSIVDGRKIGKAVQTTNTFLAPDKKVGSVARFTRYQHYEYDCSTYNDDGVYVRMSAFSMYPDDVITPIPVDSEWGGWKYRGKNNLQYMYGGMMACDELSSQIQEDGSLSRKNRENFIFDKRKCILQP